ncbi:DUF981 family protein [Couchioplanes caeruleus]|uniref:DUF981 family protein n=2 Tax=Couchioplanes caeruleus TaxID=56438 RepID=A0A1K0FLM7_9ACTN|nr:DUF981 family protein [Couchioplanes caeruleus]OJF13749.1 hypothetical protein BG844_13510 [Couchioplanes caeruleus subsp. caeruleus]ROP33479.1 uncharacterized protein DUF981 [Couchioplanes caeruleus]
MRLIMFNTTMGVAAGLALMLVPRFCAVMRGDRPPLLLVNRKPAGGGWAATFGVLGAILTGLGFVMTVWHPLAPAKDYIDTIFGEPSLILGVLLLAAAWYLARTGDPLDPERLRTALSPASWVVFWLGIVLAWCAAAIARFDVVSSAPAEEPITGLLHDWPMIENLFFAVVLYGLAAVGCLAFPFAIRPNSRIAWLLMYWAWTVSGVAFALFSAMNFYTHTGLLINLGTDGPGLRW